MNQFSLNAFSNSIINNGFISSLHASIRNIRLGWIVGLRPHVGLQRDYQSLQEEGPLWVETLENPSFYTYLTRKSKSVQFCSIKFINSVECFNFYVLTSIKKAQF